MGEEVNKVPEEKSVNLWEQVGNRCLKSALAALEKETVPTAATVETVRGLIGTAISIDMLNLRWSVQNRCGAAVFRDRLSSPPKAGS